MAYLETRQLSFTYPEGKRESLHKVSLTIEEGDFVLLCGPTGSGKTTLLHHLKKEILPVGKRTGDIFFQDIPFHQFSERGTVTEIGIVFQDPDNQIVMETVSQELAFALENLGCSPPEMHKRIGEMVHFFGMEEWFHNSVHNLSGGQKQVLNLASVLLLQPKVVLLDEPTSQLDPVAARDFLHLVQRINEEFSTTIVISEHRLTEIFPCTNKVVMMDHGEIVYAGKPKELILKIWEEQDQDWRLYLPEVSRLFLTMNKNRSTEPEQIPITVKEGKRWLNKVPHLLKEIIEISNGTENGRKKQMDTSSPLLTCKELTFQYTKAGRRILNGLNYQIPEGEIMAIMGGNGAGKSTLLKVMLGLLKPQQGKVYFQGNPVLKIKEEIRFAQIGYLDQNPKLYFAHDTVDQVLQARATQLKLANGTEKIKLLMDELQILPSSLLQHPYDLSGGEQQKLALALVLLAQPCVLLLDEPTKGLDPKAKKLFASQLQNWRQNNMTIVLISHDLEFVAQYATKCSLLFDGKVTESTIPNDFFSTNYFYSTSIQRIFKGHYSALASEIFI